MAKKTKIFRNRTVDKKQLKQIMSWAFSDFGIMKASYLANKLKGIGFQYATQAGLSISIEDLRVPPIKSNLIAAANKKVYQAEFEVDRGEITEVERFQKVINTWNTTSETLKDQVITYFRQTDPLNSIYMMAFSGARGNLSQVRQLVGMRGLMADPNGQIIDLPIVTNFREGLTVTDYIISSYGARKGLVDTALRTADSGYLTRRLIDVAQDMITREKNCRTQDGISLTNVLEGSNTLISLEERIVGRLLSLPIYSTKDGGLIVPADQEITPILAKKISELNLTKVIVRSPLTCGSSRSVCQQCYGWNLAYGNLIDLGEAVGIIAAQSIGEPGTQLTMRTFHTGGVFTTEPSRQIRAQYSGKIIFSKILKTQITRTQYGEVAYISENESSLTLITYDNLKIDLEILPETLILVKDKSFIKKNDILFELTSKTRKTGGEKAFKSIYANQSGEVLLENEKTREPDYVYNSKLTNKPNCLLWILSGQVYNIPLKSVIKIKPNTLTRKNQTIAEAKLISITGGIININSNTEQESNNDFSIFHNTESLNNTNIYLEQNRGGMQKCLIYGSQNRRIVLNSLNPSKIIDGNSSTIAQLINLNYRTKTGGTFYSRDFNNIEENLSFSKNKIKPGGTCFYIPESTYQIHQDINQLYVKNGDFIKAKTEIFKDNFSTVSGLVDISENKKTIVTIKPARLLQVKKERNLKFYHQKLLYPGEILFEDLIIERLSFTEVKTINKEIFICIYPIMRYEIINDPNELRYFSSSYSKINNDIRLGNLQSTFTIESKFKENLPVQFIKREILCQPVTTTKNFTVKIQLIKKTIDKINVKLKLLIIENLSIDKFIPKELKKADLTITNLINNEQFIEPYSNITAFQVLISEKNNILSIKEQYLGKERKVFITTNKDYKKVFVEQVNMLFQENKLIKFGEKTQKNFISKNSGFIAKIYGNTLTVHLGQPYLFSQGAIIERRPGDLVKQGDGLGQLVYERARTGDIVQGLPRVEEILEARKPKLEATIATRPGIIVDIEYNQLDIHVWIAPTVSENPEKDRYVLNYSKRLLIGKFEFINVGQPLNEASVNPHTILDIYFLYYSSLKLLTPYHSAYKSLRKIQAVLLNSVQAVYYSQGVSIADKHVEIIIKQMTGKVQITSSGESPLLPDEVVDLRHVYYINNCLKEKENALFRPILLGITKASLKTNSFISAASFQHTTRVLTEAAIQGKIDWLRGLKENVIVGRLIPAGTGFNAYSDISYIGVKVPYIINKTVNNSPTTTNKSRDKFNTLKNHLKFKIFKTNT
jgi:DNA-directed RNA polymerase subunit beta'